MCTKNGLNPELSPERAAFSLALRSKSHMFLGGNAVGAAVGCAFLDFSRHGRFMFGKIELYPIAVVFFVCRL